MVFWCSLTYSCTQGEICDMLCFHVLEHALTPELLRRCTSWLPCLKRQVFDIGVSCLYGYRSAKNALVQRRSPTSRKPQLVRGHRAAQRFRGFGEDLVILTRPAHVGLSLSITTQSARKFAVQKQTNMQLSRQKLKAGSAMMQCGSNGEVLD